MDALLGCTHVAGDLRVHGGDIASLASLGTLQIVDGTLTVEELGQTDLSGLAEVRTVGGSLVLGQNVASTSQMTALETVGADLVLSHTDVQSLRGFGNLTSIGGDLRLDENDQLGSVFSAFGALGAIGGGTIELHNDPQLRPCLFDGLVARTGAAVDVEGCSSLACGGGGGD